MLVMRRTSRCDYYHFKRVKVVDRTKCVICQVDKTDETLRKASALGLESFSIACKIRKDEVYK